MMRGPTTTTLLLIVLLLGGLLVRPTTAQGGRYALTVQNGTGREFYRLHISWSRDKEWGPNLLQNVLRPGTSVVQRNIVPAEYDLLLVDSNGTACTLRNVKVYNDITVSVVEAHCR
jgi:hypothetical protein